jgi:hypothetical protein
MKNPALVILSAGLELLGYRRRCKLNVPNKSARRTFLAPAAILRRRTESASDFRYFFKIFGEDRQRL